MIFRTPLVALAFFAFLFTGCSNRLSAQPPAPLPFPQATRSRSLIPPVGSQADLNRECLRSWETILKKLVVTDAGSPGRIEGAWGGRRAGLGAAAGPRCARPTPRHIAPAPPPRRCAGMRPWPAPVPLPADRPSRLARVRAARASRRVPARDLWLLFLVQIATRHRSEEHTSE